VARVGGDDAMSSPSSALWDVGCGLCGQDSSGVECVRVRGGEGGGGEAAGKAAGKAAAGRLSGPPIVKRLRSQKDEFVGNRMAVGLLLIRLIHTIHHLCTHPMLSTACVTPEPSCATPLNITEWYVSRP
jgi:hypothetical protein